MVLERAGAQPLGFPSLPLPSLPSAPPAPNVSDLLGFAGLQPHPHHVNDSLNPGASTKEPPASPRNMPGKSQGTGVSSSLWPSMVLGQKPLPAPIPLAFCPSPPGLTSLTLSPGHTWFVFRRRHDFTVYFYPAHC